MPSVPMMKVRVLVCVLALGLFACGSDDDDDAADAASGADAPAAIDAPPGNVDAPPGNPDAATPDAAPPDATQAADHTQNNGGVWHMPGHTNPLANCVSCHGADLTGGDGPSCYSCHNADDHTINRGGTMHRGGGSSTCNTCHGPSNSGGLGPACSECH